MSDEREGLFCNMTGIGWIGDIFITCVESCTLAVLIRQLTGMEAADKGYFYSFTAVFPLNSAQM